MKNVNKDPYKISDYKENKNVENQRLDNVENSLTEIVNELKKIGNSLEKIKKN